MRNHNTVSCKNEACADVVSVGRQSRKIFWEVDY